jgi:chemotaxis protein CheZ
MMMEKGKMQDSTLPSYGREQVVDIINSVLCKIRAPNEISRDNLMQELTELKEIIENLRNQLQATQPGDIRNTHIPSASDELNAIVTTTEEATETIMESCESIMESAKDSDEEIQQKIEGFIVKIYEACTFQDLTGQRIKKVSTSLFQIDEKVSAIINMLHGSLNIKHDESPAPATRIAKIDNHDSLLNGPALPQNAVTQDDIDKILAQLNNAGK